MKTLDKKMEKLQEEVGDRLLELRTRREMSQQALADKCDVDRKTINRIERGHFSPNLNTLLRICIALNVVPSEIVPNPLKEKVK